MLLGKALRPMEPVRFAKPFDSPEWGFQIKWDGVRILAHRQGRDTILFNKRLHQRTAQYPELVQALQDLFPEQELILDGEAVVIVEGKPQFYRVLQRESAVSPAAIRNLAQHSPVAYMVFDILYLNGQELCACTFQERQLRLKELSLNGPLVYPVETVWEKGEAVFAAAVAHDLEGIVAKQISSRYLIGKKSDYWRKIKNLKQQGFVVGGCLWREGRPAALLLGKYADEELVYVGRVSAGLSESQFNLINTSLAAPANHPCPFSQVPRLTNEAGEVRWLPPYLVVLVEFLEWTDDLKVRHPKVLGFSATDPNECRLDLI